MSGVRSPQILSLGPVSVCPPSSSVTDAKARGGESPDPPHQQRSRGQAETSPLTLPVFHSFTCAHSRTDTVVQCLRCQPLASSRCLKTGGTSVLDPFPPPPLPFFSSASGHLCWGKTGREERADSLPLSSYVHTTKTQNSFNQKCICSGIMISLSPPFFSACSSKYLHSIFFFLPQISIQTLLSVSSVSKSLRGGSLFIPTATWGK